jgi:hypothetical protein
MRPLLLFLFLVVAFNADAAPGFVNPPPSACGATNRYGRPGFVNPSAGCGFVNQYSTTFDGTNDYVDLGAPADLNGALNGRELTISAWVRIDVSVASGTNLAMVTKNDGVTAHAILYRAAADMISFYAGGAQVIGGSALLTSTWYHVVAVVRNDAGTYRHRTFRNAVQQAGPANSGAGTNAAAWLIGRNSAASPLYWKGSIDEVSFWSAGLTDGEISAIYNNGKPADLSRHSRASTLLHWYRMGDGDTFPTITDRKGSSNGTATNMAGAGNFAADVP